MFIGAKLVDLDNLSITTQIESNPLRIIGKPSTNTTYILSHFHSKMSKGVTNFKAFDVFFYLSLLTCSTGKHELICLYVHTVI